MLSGIITITARADGYLFALTKTGQSSPIVSDLYKPRTSKRLQDAIRNAQHMQMSMKDNTNPSPFRIFAGIENEEHIELDDDAAIVQAVLALA
jgi:hypothetical protein